MVTDRSGNSNLGSHSALCHALAALAETFKLTYGHPHGPPNPFPVL